MGFQKGISGNSNGRPTGTPNKTGGKLRQLITDFLERKFEQVSSDFDQLDSRDKFRVYTDLLKFSLPTLQATSITNDLQAELENLSDEGLEALANRLLQHSQ